jgi:hypothetical protein
MGDLSERLRGWMELYPDPRASREDNAVRRRDEGAWLARFAGKDRLSRTSVEELIAWKFPSRALYRNRALDGIGRNWAHVSERIKAAIASIEDEEALDLLLGSRGGIYGFGPAMGSVILAATRPDEFTIADFRALATVRRLKLLRPGPVDFRRDDWVPYLAACRYLSDETGLTLRQVDQALWVANGATR